MGYKRVFKDMISLLFGNVGLFIVSLISLSIIARIFSKEEMGIYSLIIIAINFVTAFSIQWSEPTLIQHGRKEFIHHKKVNKTFWGRMCILLPTISSLLL